jgi:hypothetical protein
MPFFGNQKEVLILALKILIDLAHNERLKFFPDKVINPSEVLFSFNDASGDLSDEKVINKNDLIIFGHPVPRENQKDKLFTTEEMKVLEKFVKEGKSILLISGSRGDYNYSAQFGSLRLLKPLTGIAQFEYGLLMNSEPESFVGKKFNLKIPQLNPKSKIGRDPMNQPMILSKCTLLKLDPEIPTEIVASAPMKTVIQYYESKKKILVDQSPLIVTREYEKGRVLTIASTQLFTDDPEVGIDVKGNNELIKRMLSWLIRKKLK